MSLKLTNLEKSKINDFIHQTLKNSSLEFEAKIQTDTLTVRQTDFINVIKQIKSQGFKNETVNEMVLDISFSQEESMRVTIHGDENIKRYCHDNSIQKIKDSVEFIEKKRFSIGKVETRPLDLRNYNIRVNLKEEKNLPPKNKNVLAVTQKFASLDKNFRYKKRFSFISSDKLFKFDLTVVKSSSRKEISFPKKKITKGEVLEKMKKYVIKPKGAKLSFTEWWDSLDDSAVVSLKEQNYFKTMYFTNLKDSQTLENDMSYEIELEFIGTKNKEIMKEHKTSELAKLVNTSVQKHLYLILQSLQQSEFVISNQEKKSVRNDFYAVTQFFRFTDSMPMAITMDMNNIIELEPDQYKNQTNIRKNYSVTEKTDGERNILFIASNGEIYLINRQNHIKKMGVKCHRCTNTVIDGEYLIQNLNGKKIRLFLAFDIYFSDGEDFRERILMRSSKDVEDKVYEKSRLEELEDVVNMLDLEREECEIEFSIDKKVFKFGNVLDEEVDYSKMIEEREEYLLNHQGEITEQSKHKLFNDIELAKQSSKIFEESHKILTQIASQHFNYLTDGLIFTPIYMTVGQGERKKNKYGGRWSSLLKWKSSEDNTIDFKVKIIKDETGKDLETYKTQGDEVLVYKKVKLLVGYDKDAHKLLNGFRVLNEDPQYLDGYSIIPFEPLSPFSNKIYECYLLVSKNGLVCQNGDSILTNNIIEFKWDSTAMKGFNWVPIRKRDILIPNAYATACNIWDTIFHPITTEMISTGQNIPIAYYDMESQKTGSMRSVYRFHNLVKKALLHKHCDKGSRVLDLGCGEMGDLLKYLDLELELLVGIDNNKHNLINPQKGALKRILDYKKNLEAPELDGNHMLDRTFLVWGDASKNIASGQAGLDSLHKFYLDLLYGNIIKREHLERLSNPKLKKFRGSAQGKFDLISCQFAMHYFFQNTKTINEFLLNISENLKLGGKMVATFFDGEKIFKLLEGHKKVECKDKQGKLLWRIEKKYQVSKFTADEKCLSLPISVYIETFTKSFEEYLINISYLKEFLPLYGLEIQSLKSFKDLQKEIRYQELDSDQEIFSFLNTAMVLVKTKEIESEQSEMSGGGSKNQLDIFISRQDQLGGGISDMEDVLDDEDMDGEDMDGEDMDGEDMDGDFEESDVDLSNQSGGKINIKDGYEDEDENDNENENANINNNENFNEEQNTSAEVTPLLNEEGDALVEDALDLGDVDELQEVALDENQVGGGPEATKSKTSGDELVTTKLSSILETPDLDASNIDMMTQGKSFGSLVEEVNNNSLDVNEEMEQINLKLEEIQSKNQTPQVQEVEEEKTVDKNVKVVKIDLDKKRMS